MCLIVKSIYDSLFYLIVIIRSSHAWNVQSLDKDELGYGNNTQNVHVYTRVESIQITVYRFHNCQLVNRACPFLLTGLAAGQSVAFMALTVFDQG